MAGPGIPDPSEDLTAGWLHAALVAGGRPHCPPIRDLTSETIGEGVGLMGEIFRCEVTFAGGARPPESVIVKLPSRKRTNRKLGRRWGLYRREYSFYRHLASGLPLRTPRLLYGAFEARSHRFVLVLEDLGGMAAGDQVEGASPEQVRRAVRAAARLHGSYWDRVEPLAAAGLGETLNPRLWLGLQVLYLASLPRSLARLADWWSDEVRELAEEYGFRLADHLTHLSGEPRTFVHGDYRVDNMFFGEDHRDGFAVVDWQNGAISIGLYDVAYFLAGSVSAEVRRAVENDALREYHDLLCSLGVRDFPFERCWRLYREALLGCLVLPAVVAGQLTDPPDRQLRLEEAIAKRTAAAIRDRGAGAFLPPLPPVLSPAGLRRILCRGGYRVYRALG